MMAAQRRWPLAVLLVVLVGAALCAGAWLVETRAHPLRRLYDDLVLDNRGHYLPCEALPPANEVRAALETHADEVEAIEAVNPGLAGVEVEDRSCPGKADLVIWYASHQNRLAIEALLGDGTFHGVPVRLQNR